LLQRISIAADALWQRGDRGASPNPVELLALDRKLSRGTPQYRAVEQMASLAIHRRWQVRFASAGNVSDTRSQYSKSRTQHLPRQQRRAASILARERVVSFGLAVAQSQSKVDRAVPCAMPNNVAE